MLNDYPWNVSRRVKLRDVAEAFATATTPSTSASSDTSIDEVTTMAAPPSCGVAVARTTMGTRCGVHDDDEGTIVVR